MATVRKQAGRALLVAWGMRAFWARQKVYVLTHLHRQITLLYVYLFCPPPPLNSPLAVKSQPFAEHGHVRLFVKPSSYEFLGAFFSKGRPFSIWLSTQFSRGCRGPPASGDAFSRGIEMACYVTPPVQCRWRCGERGLFDAKSVKLRISPKTGCVARFPAAFPFCSAGCFFQAGETMVVFAAAVRESSLSRSAQQSGGFHVERDAVCKEVRLCRMGDGTIIRPLCCPCLRALASRQKLFWRRSGKSFVMPAFTPCLQKPLSGAFGRRFRQRYWAFGRRGLRCGANRFLTDGRLRLLQLAGKAVEKRRIHDGVDFEQTPPRFSLLDCGTKHGCDGRGHIAMVVVHLRASMLCATVKRPAGFTRLATRFASASLSRK